MSAPRRWVMVVDDEDLVRWSLKQRLEEEGFGVLVAETGGEALAHDAGADLVLLDLRLPDRDGLAVARTLRAMRPDRPVLLMTAYRTPDVAEEADSSVACRVLMKPFDLDDVVRAVRDALASGGSPSPPRSGG